MIEIHGNAKSRGVGGKDLGRHRLKIDPRRSKNNKSLISFTIKVSLKLLMIRNPKDFGVWPACRQAGPPTPLESILSSRNWRCFLVDIRMISSAPMNRIKIFTDAP